MLVLPLILGFGLAGLRPSAAWLVPVAVILAFLSYYSIVPVIQRMRSKRPPEASALRHRSLWAGIYLTAALIAFGAVYDLTPEWSRPTLLVLAVPAAIGAGVYTVASALGHGRRVAVELLGMAAMSLSAPIMAIAAAEPFDNHLPAASLLAFTYSAATLAFVRAWGDLKEDRRSAILGCVVAYVVLLAGLGYAAWRGWFAPLLFVAFVPVVIRTVWGLARPPQFLRQLGMREIWVALSFTILSVILLGF
jgi:hypothetical protein